MDQKTVEELLKQARKNAMRSVTVPGYQLRILCKNWLDHNTQETGGDEVWHEKNPAVVSGDDYVLIDGEPVLRMREEQ